MLTLILKDLLIQKRSLYFALGYSFFMLIAFQSPGFAGTAYIIGAMAIAYLYILGGCAYDDRNKSEIVLNSLPLRRESIVLARYLSVFVFMLLGIGVMGLMGTVMKLAGLPFPQNYLRLQDILGIWVSLLLMSSLYLPIYYRFGYLKTRYFNMVIFMLFFFVPNILVEYVKENATLEEVNTFLSFINSTPGWLISLVLVIAMLMLMFISMQYSLHVYRHKEF